MLQCSAILTQEFTRIFPVQIENSLECSTWWVVQKNLYENRAFIAKIMIVVSILAYSPPIDEEKTMGLNSASARYDLWIIEK